MIRQPRCTRVGMLLCVTTLPALPPTSNCAGVGKPRSSTTTSFSMIFSIDADTTLRAFRRNAVVVSLAAGRSEMAGSAGAAEVYSGARASGCGCSEMSTIARNTRTRAQVPRRVNAPSPHPM